MFLRYILNSIKKYPVKYAVIAICEVLILVISLFASCVLMNYSSEDEKKRAMSFFFSFSKLDTVHITTNNLSEEDEAFIAEDFANLPYTTDMRERIYKFCEQSPIKINNVEIMLKGWEKNSYMINVHYFPAYEDLIYYFTESGKPDWSYPQNILPAEQQYLDKEKVIILGMGSMHSQNGEYVYSDKDHLMVGKNDDEYLILGTTEYNDAEILFGTEPDYLKLAAVDFEFTEIPMQNQVNEFNALFKETVSPDIEITIDDPPHIKDLLEKRKEISNIVVMSALILISSFNILAIFKIMADERKSEYAVFRLCGYGKFKAMLFPFAEIISLSAICAVLSCVIFAALTPLIKQSYSVVTVMFDFGFYAVFVLGFVAVTSVLFAVYILPSLNKSVSDELREM